MKTGSEALKGEHLQLFKNRNAGRTKKYWQPSLEILICTVVVVGVTSNSLLRNTVNKLLCFVMCVCIYIHIYICNKSSAIISH